MRWHYAAAHVLPAATLDARPAINAGCSGRPLAGRLQQLVLVLVASAGLLAGCAEPVAETPSDDGSYADLPVDQIEFADQVESNSSGPADLAEVEFVDTAGRRVRVADYRDQKFVVLVFTRGFSYAICPYCTAQTSRLIANYDQFQQRDAEVLLVYPGARDHLDEFLHAARTAERQDVERVPFPILLDEDLAAVNYFEIAAELALPSTFILDKSGEVRFGYVGSGIADRPSVQALLDQLDTLRAQHEGS